MPLPINHDPVTEDNPQTLLRASTLGQETCAGDSAELKNFASIAPCRDSAQLRPQVI